MDSLPYSQNILRSNGLHIRPNFVILVRITGEIKFDACGRRGEVELIIYFLNAVDVEKTVRC